MRSSLLVVMMVLAVGCGSEEPSTETAETSSGQRATSGGESEMASPDSTAANCPMYVEGTSVQAENVEGGAALTFVTTGDVAALRERVRNMASAHESHAMHEAQEFDMGGTTRPGETDEAAAAKIGDAEDADDGVSAGGMPQGSTAGYGEVDADTRVEDIEGGARLFLIATNPSDVEDLRIEIEHHAQRMAAGECEMAPHSMQPSGAIVQ